MDIRFDGKKVLVTGGSQGIGRALSVKLAECGAKVITIGRNLEKLKSLSDQFDNITTIAHDITDWESTQKIVNDIGPVDCLVNNAGTGILQKVGEITPDAFDTCFNVNVRALLNISQTVSTNMKKANISGSIVNVSSQASKAALAEHAVYCGTKGAVDAITGVLALELGPHNIRVNSVNPTVVMTELGKYAWSDPKKRDPMKAKIPLGRFAEEEDVVNAVLFLLSDKSQLISGTCLPVDGGFLAC